MKRNNEEDTSAWNRCTDGRRWPGFGARDTRGRKRHRWRRTAQHAFGFARGECAKWRRNPEQGSSEKRGQMKGAIEQKAQAPQRDKSRMSNQARPERSTTGQGSSEKDELKTKSSGKEDLKAKSSDELKSKSKSSAKEDLKAKGQDSAKDLAKGSAKTNERSTTGQGTSDKTDMKGAADSKTQTPNATGQNQTSGSATQNQTGANIQSQAGAKLTSQQQTTIQQSVLSARNVPRVDHVNFAVHTGAIIPRSVNIVAISTFPVLIETFPQYRDYSFFVVEDEIVFVDRGHKVVDVVPAGPRTRFSRASSSTTVAVNLSEPEIREVQLVLVQRGFLHGRASGVWGPETHEALIAFQRKEGFSATGSIDTRTVGALGLSGKVKARSQARHRARARPDRGASRVASRPGTNAPAQNNATGQTGTQKPSDKQAAADKNLRPRPVRAAEAGVVERQLDEQRARPRSRPKWLFVFDAGYVRPEQHAEKNKQN